jgi:choline-glycine betaine transporter
MKLLSNVWRDIRNFFVPKYNEYSVFFIALSIVLLSCFDAELEKTIISTIKEKVDNPAVFATVPGLIYLVGVPSLFIAGLFLSVFHAFSKRHKTKTEKVIILYFALSITGIAGIIAGMQVLNNGNESLIVFPVLNILTSVFNLYLIGFTDDKMMDD